MTAEEWIQALAQQLGVESPAPDQIEAILELAGTAAHASERVAAPVAAWLAGTSGRPLSEVNELAKRLAGRPSDQEL
jgi:uncharacterized protein DUF6457